MEAENANLLAAGECHGSRIERLRHRINAQGRRGGRVNKPLLPSQHGRERPAIRVGGRDEEIAQQLEEASMLIRHEVSDSASLRGLAGARLRLALVRMKGRRVHRVSPACCGAAEADIGLKPGTFSMRLSQARTEGKSSSAIPPSGACAT